MQTWTVQVRFHNLLLATIMDHIYMQTSYIAIYPAFYHSKLCTQKFVYDNSIQLAMFLQHLTAIHVNLILHFWHQILS